MYCHIVQSFVFWLRSYIMLFRWDLGPFLKEVVGPKEDGRGSHTTLTPFQSMEAQSGSSLDPREMNRGGPGKTQQVLLTTLKLNTQEPTQIAFQHLRNMLMLNSVAIGKSKGVMSQKVEVVRECQGSEGQAQGLPVLMDYTNWVRIEQCGLSKIGTVVAHHLSRGTCWHGN